MEMSTNTSVTYPVADLERGRASLSLLKLAKKDGHYAALHRKLHKSPGSPRTISGSATDTRLAENYDIEFAVQNMNFVYLSKLLIGIHVSGRSRISRWGGADPLGGGVPTSDMYTFPLKHM